MIEKNENPKTVWHYVHNMWKKEPRLIHLSEKRLWLSIIHGKNKVNEFDGYGNIKWNSLKMTLLFLKKFQKQLRVNNYHFLNGGF
ncbi:hypothetical protein [Flavobacterium piscinae]|uniref:hypothetical protein n=1 Tax=Flavobacterium piscinae TaxID=2506424 RepID=UPI002AABD825|nr:hypothetical protein [Flavobacterium piscinae]